MWLLDPVLRPVEAGEQAKVDEARQRHALLAYVLASGPAAVRPRTKMAPQVVAVLVAPGRVAVAERGAEPA